ncbi:MAG TPA: hypothetical protein GX716_08180 [Firmicutes bacterium]|nr:hypothetical protein [Candidatus Fermentithermobacillaceae bacterium]
MKSLDYRKDFKTLYLPPTKPVLVDVPPALYAVIDGHGNPNDNPEFQAALQALYAVSYGIKMLPKKGIQPEGYYQYTVFPLEGLWDMPRGAASNAEAEPELPVDKNSFLWRLMIRQPDFVTQELFDMVKDMSGKKKDAPDLSRVNLETITDGLSVQMTHIGSYDSEPASFAKMDEYCASEGLIRIGHIHREIYMSDPRRTAPEKIRTVLRYFVKRA